MPSPNRKQPKHVSDSPTTPTLKRETDYILHCRQPKRISHLHKPLTGDAHTTGEGEANRAPSADTDPATRDSKSNSREHHATALKFFNRAQDMSTPHRKPPVRKAHTTGEGEANRAPSAHTDPATSDEAPL